MKLKKVNKKGVKNLESYLRTFIKLSEFLRWSIFIIDFY